MGSRWAGLGGEEGVKLLSVCEISGKMLFK